MTVFFIHVFFLTTLEVVLGGIPVGGMGGDRPERSGRSDDWSNYSAIRISFRRTS
jgi:hypothetical protein